MASQFSKDGKYFAQLTSDGKLKVWNTKTSTFEQEFTPDFHLSSPCTCLHFIQPTNVARKSGSPRKKIKRRDSLDITTPYIVIGTTSGLLLVYSITKSELDFTINSETSQSINCLSWQEGVDVYSAVENNILSWDLQKKSIKSKWKAGNEKISSILLLLDEEQLLTASKNIKLWNIKSKEVLKTFTGHSHNVSILEYINPGKSDAYFVSGSKGDRLLSCWNLKDESTNAVVNLSMEDVASTISILTNSDDTTRISAVTNSGVCHIFQLVLNGKASKPIKPKTTIKIATDSKSAVAPIPIIASLLEENVLQIAHGNQLLLTFENLQLSLDQKVQCLIRKDPRQIKKQQETDIAKIKSPITDDSAVHYLTPHTTNKVADAKRRTGTSEVPMEQRLENLTLNKLDGSTSVPKANNVAHLLLQGLQSKDKNILLNILSNKDESVVRNTVRRLPMPLIVSLVKELTSLVQGKTVNCQVGVLWLKTVLKTHAGLLVSNPEIPELLNPVLGSIDSRLNLQMPLCRLKGRLNLLISQVSATSKPNDDEEEEAALVYNDKAASDSETEMLELGLQSESDNEWSEEDSDIENEVEENGDDNSDEDMSP